ncbi:MAG: hypothetical protein WCP87_04080 [Atribacterota bacterium]
MVVKSDKVKMIMKLQDIKSNSDLARKMGVSKSYISMVLKKGKPVGQKFMSGLVNLSGMEAHELFYFDHEVTKRDNKNKHITSSDILPANPPGSLKVERLTAKTRDTSSEVKNQTKGGQNEGHH